MSPKCWLDLHIWITRVSYSDSKKGAQNSMNREGGKKDFIQQQQVQRLNIYTYIASKKTT